MKRIAIFLAGLTATLLTICFLEYGVRGLNPAVESDWCLHPAWWQSDFLADGGLYLWLCVVRVSSPFERSFGGHIQAFFILCILLQILIIAAVSLVVFYAARLLRHLPGRIPSSGESVLPAGH